MVEVQKPMFFVRFLRCSRNPLRESAWSRCKNSRFFATFVVRTGPRELSRGSRACSRNRRVAGSIPPWSAGGRRKMQLAFYSNLRRTTCAEQVAQSNLRRPTCTDQFAQSALPRATCAEQLTQSNLHRATCTEQLAQSNLQGAQFAQSNLQGPTCRSNLRGATCAEQLAQCNLRRATCADQLAPTSLRRAPCLVLSRACFTKCREKERILQRWADLACDVLLSGQPWSSFRCRNSSGVVTCLQKETDRTSLLAIWACGCVCMFGGSVCRKFACTFDVVTLAIAIMAYCCSSSSLHMRNQKFLHRIQRRPC